MPEFSGSGGGNVQLGIVTSDVTVNNSTTLVNATGLSFTVSASKRYAFYIWIHYNSGTTPDIKFDWSIPSSDDGEYSSVDSQVNAVAAIGTVDNVNGLGSARAVFRAGWVLIGDTGGTMQMQFAQQTADASDTKVLAGSYVLAVEEN